MDFRAGSRGLYTRDVARFSECIKIQKPRASVILHFLKVEQIPNAWITLSCTEKISNYSIITVKQRLTFLYH